MFFFCLAGGISAAQNIDPDSDGISTQDEINIYKTNPDKADTDGDGFSDWLELNKGFSPINKNKITLKKADSDKDGLSDEMELRFHTDLSNPDTDGDGKKDGKEIADGYSPLTVLPVKLEKIIKIDLKKQELSNFMGGVRLNTFRISSGKRSTPTPKGKYTITNKAPKAWSRTYGLWMPYWMGLGNGKIGIHELPYWPNGYREGASHLGIPVSHGCIRLGIGPAKEIYSWAEAGTEVLIY
jgi:hypothetical protein